VTFPQARQCVVDHVRAAAPFPGSETVALIDSAGRILAEPVAADRDLPPAPRSIRDGYALRASATPGVFRIAGEVRAGEPSILNLNAGEAIEIMTGAVVPEGADSVVMLEHITAQDGKVRVDAAVPPGSHINPRGSEARAGDWLLSPGTRIGYAEIAVLAATGRLRATVYRKPSVAIVSTGDEVVEIDMQPAPHQVRNSNAYALAAQVVRAGGVPRILPVARDTLEDTCLAIERGLGEDLLLLSGGVSAGKYDVVEQALARFGAEFYFDRVRIQPGQPMVFGRARQKFFFGLPGNPVSTMVTFELIGRIAVDLLSGRSHSPLPLTLAPLAAAFRHQTGLTRFLPARLNDDGTLSPVRWQGSGDLAAHSRANAYLVADPDRAEWEKGDLIQVLLQ